MKGPHPENTHLPTDDGGYSEYKAAGKLKGKKALITGGDSGIGRAVAILFAMEGAESMITYLPAEEKDAKTTVEECEKKGGKCHIVAADLRDKKTCKAVVDEAYKKMGAINILINNHAVQQTIDSIIDLTE